MDTRVHNRLSTNHHIRVSVHLSHPIEYAMETSSSDGRRVRLRNRKAFAFLHSVRELCRTGLVSG